MGNQNAKEGVTAKDLVVRREGKQALIGIDKILCKAGMNENGEMNGEKWKSFFNSYHGWLKDKGLLETVDVWMNACAHFKGRIEELGNGCYRLTKTGMTDFPPYLPPTSPPPQYQNAQEPNCWVCPRCGQQNPLTVDICVACGGPRPHPARLFPMRTVVVPGAPGAAAAAVGDAVVPGQEARTMLMYRPWSPSEQLALISLLPDPSQSPMGFARMIRTIQDTYNATRLDLQGVIKGKLADEAHYDRLTDETYKQYNNRTGPEDAEPNNAAAGVLFTTALVKACKDRQGERQVTLEDRVQGKEEDPKDYFWALRKTWSEMGFIPENKTSERLLASAFMNGLKKEIAEKVKASRPEWRSVKAEDLARIAQGAQHDIIQAKRAARIHRVETTPRNNRGRGRTAGGGQRLCYGCRKPGHFRKDCRTNPYPDAQSTGPPANQTTPP
ncbi:uncharacterized protein [Phyllobates terribilis]|uniref:uncharacterized protein n=1 Tax=Phyllobates terribilis TaxID=111132 RepID=UPI003CCA7F5A